jgi:hypothetical protein
MGAMVSALSQGLKDDGATPADSAMVLFDDIVERRDLADVDRGAVRCIVALDGRFMGRTPVDGDRLRHPMTTDGLGQEACRGLLIALAVRRKSSIWPV